MKALDWLLPTLQAKRQLELVSDEVRHLRAALAEGEDTIRKLQGQQATFDSKLAKEEQMWRQRLDAAHALAKKGKRAEGTENADANVAPPQAPTTPIVSHAVVAPDGKANEMMMNRLLDLQAGAQKSEDEKRALEALLAAAEVGAIGCWVICIYVCWLDRNEMQTRVKDLLSSGRVMGSENGEYVSLSMLMFTLN
jgi:hypothetical protein